MLNIFVEISNVVPGTRSDTNGPTTTIRTTETSVEVRDTQMVVTGGLIQDSTTDSVTGVPFLKDVPVLGNFFKTENKTNIRTNLLLFITPRIIRDQFEARDVTREKAYKLENEISVFNSGPNRREVLRSGDMDKVAGEYLGEKFSNPSPITPPNNPRGINSSPSSFKQDNSEIEINVSPSLPGQELSNILNDNTLTPNKTFFVLRAIDNKRLPSRFESIDSLDTFGVEVLADLNTSVTDFFSVGKRISFDNQGDEHKFVSLGVYSSKQEAAKVHSEFSVKDQWYSLSTKEALAIDSLGNNNGNDNSVYASKWLDTSKN